MGLRKNKDADAPVVFLAPGAGLGHLVRVSAIAVALKQYHLSAVIVTYSTWARALAGITGITTIQIPAATWTCDLVPCLKTLSPKIIVQDSFPFGLKKENPQHFVNQVPFVYLARVLKNSYWQMHDGAGFSMPSMTTIIKIEPLTAEHDRIICNSGCTAITLKERICFPAQAFARPVPDTLAEQMNGSKVHLIVHSGPGTETRQLMQLAQENIKQANIKQENGGTMALIHPVLCSSEKNAWDYFPAAVLYLNACHIYSGTGYNSVAEQMPFMHKVTRIAFNRRYDDQAFRESTLPCTGASVQNGARQAAAVIAQL